ncbi:hypothetical protein B4113_2415 [Geobacillus sp. B4113_201601]|nr:hypothetical protein B4113_2415 [Geobacillus sp. B4113_201601]
MSPFCFQNQKMACFQLRYQCWAFPANVTLKLQIDASGWPLS